MSRYAYTQSRGSIFVTYLTSPPLQFNRFWLDPENPESFPPGLLEALEELLSSSSSGAPGPGSSDVTRPGQGEGLETGTSARLKAQMQADALRPLKSGSIGNGEDEDGECLLRMGTGADSDREDPVETIAVWPEETLHAVGDYLRLRVSCPFPAFPPRFPFIGRGFGLQPSAPTLFLSRNTISPFG